MKRILLVTMWTGLLHEETFIRLFCAAGDRIVKGAHRNIVDLAPLFIAHTARAAFPDQRHPFRTVVYLSLRHLHRPPIMILECLTTVLPDRL